MNRLLLRRKIQWLEQKAIRAAAEGETMKAIKLRRAMLNAQVKLWKLTVGAS